MMAGRKKDLDIHPEGYAIVVPTLRGWVHAAVKKQDEVANLPPREPGAGGDRDGKAPVEVPRG